MHVNTMVQASNRRQGSSWPMSSFGVLGFYVFLHGFIVSLPGMYMQWSLGMYVKLVVCKCIVKDQADNFYLHSHRGLSWLSVWFLVAGVKIYRCPQWLC